MVLVAEKSPVPPLAKRRWDTQSPLVCTSLTAEYGAQEVNLWIGFLCPTQQFSGQQHQYCKNITVQGNRYGRVCKHLKVENRQIQRAEEIPEACSWKTGGGSLLEG
ncbi:hypothetical protein AV530_009863 [Patagioenas fasciata monilis]|uniref:Uncharacterized protein n=1 Tax=Patagioenas fasciata monilis TaxID=372326 RepID=A0A1V4KAA1_PATFA|nr:hypothetical protein AV530_009863 [Patagioenas fasciata monilis]